MLKNKFKERNTNISFKFGCVITSQQVFLSLFDTQIHLTFGYAGSFGMNDKTYYSDLWHKCMIPNVTQFTNMLSATLKQF